MKPELESIPLVNNASENQFELEVDGVVAFIAYQKKGAKYALLHTEVPTALEGRGVGSAIVEKTFHYLVENNMGLIPYCPFVVAYLKRYQEWNTIFEL